MDFIDAIIETKKKMGCKYEATAELMQGLYVAFRGKREAQNLDQSAKKMRASTVLLVTPGREWKA